MISYPNRFFHGWCSNEGNQRSHILHYIISTVRDISDYNGDVVPEEVKNLEEYFNLDERSVGDPYYGIYATFKFDISKGPIKVFETEDLKSAVYILETLTGNKVLEKDVK